MFEELYEKLPDADAYLERIGLTRDQVRMDGDGLTQLVRAQLGTIPFDSLDVWGAGALPSLGVRDLFNKIITRRRGGYCFELNSLFCAFLKALGFDAYLVLVRLVEKRDFLPVTSHCAVIVECGGTKFFADVGYGGPAPYGAVEFDGLEHNGFYLTDEGEYMAMHRVDGQSAVRVMLFRDVRTDPVDLIAPNFYVSQNPTSGFRLKPSLNLRTRDALYVVSDRTFKIKTQNGTTERTLVSSAELSDIAQEYFGLVPGSFPIRGY